MHKRARKLFFWLLTILCGIAIAFLIYITFRADWFSAWYDRAIFAVLAAFFAFIEIRIIISSIQESRKPASRIWSPDRSTRKKK
jgi:membrane associated rhomboid family serine protease